MLSLMTGTVKSQDTIKYWYESFFYDQENIEIPSLVYAISDEDILNFINTDAKELKDGNDAVSAYAFVDWLDIHLIKNATEIKKADTIIYLLHFKARDSFRVGFVLNIEILEGTVIYIKEPKGYILKTLTKENNTKNSLTKNSPGTFCNFEGVSELIVEVHIGKKQKNKNKIIIAGLMYFVDLQSVKKTSIEQTGFSELNLPALPDL